MKNILLVDDDQPMLQSLAEGLHSYAEDWNIMTASNGKEGEEILASHPIDIVVTDLRMPAMDGYELLLSIRKSFPEIPVIVMSADSPYESDCRLIPLGATQCFSKPFNLNEMADAISSQLAWEYRGMHEEKYIAHR